MLDMNVTYAVIGASNDQKKYGFKVYKDLLDARYSVIPVNPTETDILGQKCYPKLSDYLEKIDFVIFAVPPAATEKVLQEIVKNNIVKSKNGIYNVWMQPGSESDKAISFCEQNKIHCIAHACIMVQRKNKDIIMPL